MHIHELDQQHAAPMLNGTNLGQQVAPHPCPVKTWPHVSIVCPAALCIMCVCSLRRHLTIGEIVASLSSTFSFDAPVVSFAYTANGPTSAQQSVTLKGEFFCLNRFDVLVAAMFPLPSNNCENGGLHLCAGVNFGAYTYTATVLIGKTVCGTTTWLSTTNLVCGVTDKAEGQALAVMITVGAQVGTATSIYSYDAPVLSLFGRNAPTSGLSYLTVQVDMSYMSMSTSIHMSIHMSMNISVLIYN